MIVFFSFKLYFAFILFDYLSKQIKCTFFLKNKNKLELHSKNIIYCNAHIISYYVKNYMRI